MLMIEYVTYEGLRIAEKRKQVDPPLLKVGTGSEVFERLAMREDTRRYLFGLNDPLNNTRRRLATEDEPGNERGVE
jgi:hypothetical protein